MVRSMFILVHWQKIGKIKTVNNIKALKRIFNKTFNVLKNINPLYSLYNIIFEYDQRYNEIVRLAASSGDQPKAAGSTRYRYECFLPCRTCPELHHNPRDDEDIGKSGDTGTRSSCSPRQQVLCVYVQRISDRVPFAGIVFSENRKCIIRYTSSRFFVMKQIN